uniref:GATOR complex protein NPRL3 n=1 Tax=Taeniopygia guttata TaxID=59729 RepID=A0A674GIZ9_TAEGU
MLVRTGSLGVQDAGQNRGHGGTRCWSEPGPWGYEMLVRTGAMEVRDAGQNRGHGGTRCWSEPGPRRQEMLVRTGAMGVQGAGQNRGTGLHWTGRGWRGRPARAEPAPGAAAPPVPAAAAAPSAGGSGRRSGRALPAGARAGMGESTSPISVILVSSGSRGNKLLFRFPFQRGAEHPAAQDNKPRSRYAVNGSGDTTEDQDGDSRFSDVILATILATKSDMCGKKFELKIDNVRFVGHPTLLQHALGQVSKTDPSPKREMPTMILFNVVFALRANADPSVISCLHNLSRRIAIVLQHEERRCQYLTREAKLILAIQDEVSAMSETTEGPQSPFHHILPKCKLARDLKETYDSLCTTGVVRLHINNWLEVSFCLPHKIHYVATNFIPPEAIERSLKSIRPYHALLLLNDEKSLLNELPLDCSPALVRVIKTTSAVKNLQQLAQDADLALLQVFQLAAHLVYWGKAIIIYPLCENNVYMLSPNASVCLYSPLADAFSCQFRGHNLPSMLAKFSLPVSLSEFKNPLAPPVQESWCFSQKKAGSGFLLCQSMTEASSPGMEYILPGKLLPAHVASARSPALMKSPESRHKESPAPLGKSSISSQHSTDGAGKSLLLQPWVSSMGAWEEQMENGWKCSAGVQKLRQQNVLAKPLLELIWENTSAFGKKWVKTWRKWEWCEALEWWYKAHHMDRGQCRMLQHLGFF